MIVAVTVVGAGFTGTAEAASNPIGIHSMLQLNDPPSFMQAVFAEAAAAGASAIRLDVAPALIFASPTQPPDFSGLDEVMSLSQDHHLPVVADLFTIPYRIADCATPTAPPAASRCPTDDLTDYGTEIGQIVARANPVIQDWEIWNEPDNQEFFTGTPQQYAIMLRTAHDAIKQVNPADEVLPGGMSGPSATNWLAQVFATPGANAARAFDIANVHERAPLDSLAPDVEAWRAFFTSYGFTGPLWITEHGYPSDPAYQYDPSNQEGLPAYLTASIPTLVDAGPQRCSSPNATISVANRHPRDCKAVMSQTRGSMILRSWRSPLMRRSARSRAATRCSPRLFRTDPGCEPIGPVHPRDPPGRRDDVHHRGLRSRAGTGPARSRRPARSDARSDHRCAGCLLRGDRRTRPGLPSDDALRSSQRWSGGRDRATALR